MLKIGSTSVAAIMVGSETVGTVMLGGQALYSAEPIVAFNARTIGEGDSLFSYVDGRSILQWLNIFLDGRLRFTPNGVAATEANAGQEWALINATAASLLAEHDPDLVLLDGGTNDTNVTVPFSAALEDAEEFIDAMNAGGAQVFYMQIPPRYDANAAGKAADRAVNNATIKGWEGSKQLKTFSVDPYWVETLDGTHQNTKTAHDVALYLAGRMDKLIEAGDPRTVLGANLFTNPSFAVATGGTLASGMAGGSVMPQGWTADNDTGATVISSVITREDGSKAIRLDVSGNATSDALDLRIFQAVAQAVVIGESYEFVADVKISGLDGQGAPTGINGWALIGANAVTFTQSQAANLGGMNFPVDNTVRCAPRPIAANAGSFTGGLYARLAIGPVAARFEFALPHIAKI